jgi:CubicO group peptidase (beta-lactamase class C family)
MGPINWLRCVIASCAMVGIALESSHAASSSAAGFEWQSAAPESRGLSSAKLDGLRDHLAAHATKAFLLVRDDRIVYEWYAKDHSATKTHFAASMAKALVGGVAVAVAISDGRFAIEDPAAKFIPQWRDHPVKARITLRQLGSHTSGLADAEADKLPHDQLTGWQGDFWKRLPVPRDPFTISRDLTPVVFSPGERINYSNPGIAMLAYATTAALKDAPEKDLRTLLRERVLRPIGVADSEWSVGYGQTAVVDGLPIVGAWGGATFTARATARIARLMLREGNWEGRALLKPEAVRAVTQDAGLPGSGAIGWWSNGDGVVTTLPRDAFWGAGAQHQLVLVIPSLKVIAVRNGGALAGTSYDQARDTLFFQPLMKAIEGKQP